MNLLIQIFINGILQGGFYIIIALGLALTWGILNIPNLTHGTFIVLGGYITWYLYNNFNIDPLLNLPIVALIMFILGYIIQRLLINFVIKAPKFNTLLLTFGLDMLLTNIIQLIFLTNSYIINPIYASKSITFGDFLFPEIKLIAFFIGIFLAIGMWFFLLYTKLGYSIRATSQNKIIARFCGINPGHLYAITFAISSAISGIAGAFYGMIFQINPYIGPMLTTKSFIISSIGGLNNPINIIFGAILLGIVESLTTLYIGPTFTDLFSFSILVLIFFFRPNGLMGKVR
ncbi:branched-chain amino acid ABC transporter permease [Candidatus Profftella armatura]|uniref:branched-chain amino acid ABC transporter permease n=1 Tax=Candidatus Profftella armatura TaxID=669502 RepID=UPI0015DD3FB1|nr:branched-chain amino acid ABC transporter permease [Candidatus Profftella armatura]QLK13740.1 branched-chain amino acid ABC transporter permease [Candidatus Profftella armatura]